MARTARPARRMLRSDQVQEIYNLSPKTLRTAVQKGSLRAYRPGGGKYSRLMFDVADLESWLESCEVTGESA